MSICCHCLQFTASAIFGFCYWMFLSSVNCYPTWMFLFALLFQLDVSICTVISLGCFLSLHCYSTWMFLISTLLFHLDVSICTVIPLGCFYLHCYLTSMFLSALLYHLDVSICTVIPVECFYLCTIILLRCFDHLCTDMSKWYVI